MRDGEGTSGLIRFDAVEIDGDGHRLRVDGVEVPLERKAFAVLLLLARHPGHVFTREEILDAVWGHAHVTPGVLNRIVTLLRQALGESGESHRYLHTVHGVGYRLDLPGASAESPETAPISPAQEAVPASPSDVPGPAATTAAATSAAGETAGPVQPQRLLRAARWLVPLFVLLVLTGGWLWSRAGRHTVAPPAATAATESAPALSPEASPGAAVAGVAVLPLVNASGDQDQQFFSDGLSDNLIDALSRFDGLKVIGRISSFRFRDGNDDSRSIGAKLGVTYLVSGSVQRAGDAVRIGVELSSTTDGRTIWTEHYDRPYKDLFALQDEITRAVAGALHAKLLSSGAATKQSDRPPSGDIEAYNAYLQGLKQWHDQDFPKAAEAMTRAVQLDPGYAMAWAHLSGSWSTVAMFWNEPPDVAGEHMRQARLAADKALQLAPGLGSAHAARAYLQFYAFDYRGALAECRRAVQLAPDDGMVLNGCGHTLAGIGKLTEAIRLRERLLSIEPLYNFNQFKYAELLLATGRLDEATKYLRLAESLSPPKSSRPSQFMYVALARGDAETAQDVARNRPSPWREMYLAIATQISPDRAAADAALANVLASKGWATTSPYLIVQAYALRGDPDGTMEWLERARARDLLFLLADPLVLRFRGDPRLIAFCEKVGLPPPSESEALSIDRIRLTSGARR